MLKGIPHILSPELLKILDEMGHGDEIIIADGNFPGASLARNLVRLDGHGAAEVLRAVLQLFPLDHYEPPVYLMQKVPGDHVETPIWDEFAEILALHTSAPVTYLERYAFYERAKNAYAVIMTGERALYANILLKKGVV